MGCAQDFQRNGKVIKQDKIDDYIIGLKIQLLPQVHMYKANG